MKYLLYKAVLDESPEIEITEDEYEKLKEARSLLSSALAIETNYEILINNYLDFEKHLLNMSVDYIVRNDLDYLGFFEVRLSINIRLINLFTAFRLYVDQLKLNVKKFAVYITDIEEKVKRLLSNEYDSNKEYRFIEQLRNYVQHRGLPVHFTQLSRGRTLSESEYFLNYSIELASLKSYLEEDPKFKLTVLDELDEKIDIKVATRAYVDSISNVHKSVRHIISPSVLSSRQLIEDAHNQYKTVHTNLTGLSICKRSNECTEHTMPLLLDWDDIRVKLQGRNRSISNLRRCYVTNISGKI